MLLGQKLIHGWEDVGANRFQIEAGTLKGIGGNFAFTLVASAKYVRRAVAQNYATVCTIIAKVNDFFSNRNLRLPSPNNYCLNGKSQN